MQNTISRRGLLHGVAGLAVGRALAQPARNLVYVGSYSSPQGPEGSKGNGEGIYLFQMNPATGALTQREIFRDGSNPQWLAFNPARTHLFSANETTTFEGAATGSVGSWAIDRSSGRLKLVNRVSSQGAGPAHLSVHPSGKYVLVANYAGGVAAVLPIGAKGELGAPTSVIHDQGKIGPAHATSAPPGSFAISGHDHPHVHMIASDPSGQYVLATDLALDRIFIWKFDVGTGKLSPNTPDSVALPPGDGPRHFCFDPKGRWFYSLQEEASTLVLFDYDAKAGRLKPRQTISSLPKGFAGTDFTSEVTMSPDGKFLYAANRLHDSISWFSVGPTGELAFVGEEWTRGDYPRSFNIDPTGSFLYSCNQRSDAVTCFRINRQTGALSFTGQYTAVGTPAIIVFLT
jgi:6-phosphogluconolactonase (cycloisomerase 2 family)